MRKSSLEDVDFDAEARALWESLNLDYDSRNKGSWNPIDPIWKHPVGQGTIYVGNQTAAEDIKILKAAGITHVVNCTYGVSKIPNFHENNTQYVVKYYNFPISHWQSFVRPTHESVIEFVTPLFEFIENAVADGESVLVHCLAGAHRAGTTGCACLIHFAGLDATTAIRTAKRCRSIIDPIGQLPMFLNKLWDAYVATGRVVPGEGRGVMSEEVSRERDRNLLLRRGLGAREGGEVEFGGGERGREEGVKLGKADRQPQEKCSPDACNI